MPSLLLFILTLFSASCLWAQHTSDIVTQVLAAQRNLVSAEYTVVRTDTFVTGRSRKITGKAVIQSLPADTIFGFIFWGKRDGVDQETIYNGTAGIQVDHITKTYERIQSPMHLRAMYGAPGGQMIMPDLVKLDTSNTQELTVVEKDSMYILVFHLHDITAYNVTKRFKTVVINKNTFLPVSVRSRQETLGKIQDLYSEIIAIKINPAVISDEIVNYKVPSNYNLPEANPNQVLNALRGKPAPLIELQTFDGKKFSSASVKDKVVLLDFWEVWCGPCVASMPKIQTVYKKYHQQGLEVIGVMSEPNQLDIALKLVEKNNVTFQMLISDAATNKKFGIIAVPTYILIDRLGKVTYVSEGYSDEIERQIKQSLSY